MFESCDPDQLAADERPARAYVLADGAYGVTEITGGGLQTIVKQKGSAGTADPLDQRSSVGWKAIKTAKILIPNYLVRVECCSEYSSEVATNMGSETSN